MANLESTDESSDIQTLTLDDYYRVYTYDAYETNTFQFVPPVDGEYLFYSSVATGDPVIYLYNSNMEYIDSNDDSGGNLQFRLTVSLTAGQTYYLVCGHCEEDYGSYRITALMAAAIPNTVCYFRNMLSSNYIDIHGPNEQRYAHQWSYHIGMQLKWNIVKQTGGYYTIQSEYGNKYYLGVSTRDVGTNNVELFASVSDKTKWRIYAKSNGELFVESVYSPGCVLSVANTLIGSELQLNYISASASNANKWKIEVELPTTLEGQKMSNWCWNATARMMANHYYSVSSERTQERAVNYITNSVPDDEPANIPGGSSYAICAAKYYYEEDVETERTFDLVDYNTKRLGQARLRQFLHDGHVIFIGRGYYSAEGDRREGHASLIVGYTTVYLNGLMEYRYLIYDPWPATPPNSWETPVVTQGRRLVRSYGWICSGVGTSSELPDNFIWDTYVVFETTYAGDNLPPKYN